MVELPDIIKTDLNLKQKDFNSSCFSKNTEFIKIFEIANKSYNFNNEKSGNFSLENSEQDFLKKLSYDDKNLKFDSENVNVLKENIAVEIDKDKKQFVQTSHQGLDNNKLTSATPATPAEPATPAKSAIPATPAEPATPTTSAIPAVPATPAEPATPAKPKKNTQETNVTSENNKSIESTVQEPEKESQKSTKTESANDTARKILIETGLKDVVTEKNVKNTDKKSSVTTSNIDVKDENVAAKTTKPIENSKKPLTPPVKENIKNVKSENMAA